MGKLVVLPEKTVWVDREGLTSSQSKSVGAHSKNSSGMKRNPKQISRQTSTYAKSLSSISLYKSTKDGWIQPQSNPILQKYSQGIRKAPWIARQITPYLTKGLTDQRPEIRYQTVEAIMHTPPRLMAGVLSKLVNCLKKEKDVDVLNLLRLAVIKIGMHPSNFRHFILLLSVQDETFSQHRLSLLNSLDSFSERDIEIAYRESNRIFSGSEKVQQTLNQVKAAIVKEYETFGKFFSKQPGSKPHSLSKTHYSDQRLVATLQMIRQSLKK